MARRRRVKRVVTAAACCVAASFTLGGCADLASFHAFLCTLNGGEPEFGEGQVYCDLGDGPSRPERSAEAGHHESFAAQQAGAFTATFRGRIVNRGRIVRRGGRSRWVGIRHRGRMRVTRDQALRRPLRGFLRGRFRSRASLRTGGRAGEGRARGFMRVKLRRRRSGTLCLRVTGEAVSVQGPPASTVTFSDAGGTRRARRLRLNGNAQLSGPTELVRGQLTASRGRPKRPAAPCRRLARRGR